MNVNTKIMMMVRFDDENQSNNLLKYYIQTVGNVTGT